MRRMLVAGLAAIAGLSGWTSTASAAFFSHTGPVVAIVAGELFLGQAEGNLDGSGTIAIQSRARPDLTCRGQFTYSKEVGDAGTMQCSDGVTATFQFQRLSLVRGYGTGNTSRGPMSFTYGLGASEVAPYLTIPPGKALRMNGNDLLLADTVQPVSAIPRNADPIVPAPEVAPDALLSATTRVIIADLRQGMNSRPDRAAKLAALIDATVLPLFDFRHMTQLAVARNWRLASSAQQTLLTSEFRALLVRTYSAALANYRDQVIEYKPLRMTPGENQVTVKSTVRQPGAERMTIDYDMEKTAAGWKVYDIKVAGISLITNYRSAFDRTVRSGGVDGLIKSLFDKNRQADSGLGSGESGARPLLFLYAVIPSVFQSGR